MAKRFISPLALPVYCFAAAILAGTVALRQEPCLSGTELSWLDALFTATSAVCVTGLVVVDTGSHFTLWGQGVILVLIQLGGLGVMTYSSLVLFLWRRRVSLTDRLAVGQALLANPAFSLGRFLLFMMAVSLSIEAAGALLLYGLDPQGLRPFEALFHSVSAFCNAGFSTRADSLVAWQGRLDVNLVFMALIILGGLGFAVLHESTVHLLDRSGLKRAGPGFRVSFHTRTVLRTTAALILGGAAFLWVMELPYWLQQPGVDTAEAVYRAALTGLFQSVTSRTAGFNSVDIAALTNVSLFLIVILMLIGGSPGSCAGGLKTTTFRTLVAFLLSQAKGREQTVIRNRALEPETVNRALTLTVFGIGLVIGCTLLLCISEGGVTEHAVRRGQFLELLFEVVSAFGTVGLSTGITAGLSPFGKVVLVVLMFLGRLGPILFLSLLQSWQVRPRYAWPKESLMIG